MIYTNLNDIICYYLLNHENTVLCNRKTEIVFVTSIISKCKTIPIIKIIVFILIIYNTIYCDCLRDFFHICNKMFFICYVNLLLTWTAYIFYLNKIHVHNANYIKLLLVSCFLDSQLNYKTNSLTNYSKTKITRLCFIFLLLQ